MSENKTKPTKQSVSDFLATVFDKRAQESKTLLSLMQEISTHPGVMWGPSIIGFGTQHYKYDTGREGDMPQLAFSPRKAAITIYFNEGFDRYGSELEKLGKYKTSRACLYVNKLDDIKLNVLKTMLKKSFKLSAEDNKQLKDVDAYIASVPNNAKKDFNQLRSIVKKVLPNAKEVLSYGIVGYKTDEKRPRVFISGWKDHLAIYPLPKNPSLQKELKPYIKGKGTLWFKLNELLPEELIKRVVSDLVGTS